MANPEYRKNQTGYAISAYDIDVALKSGKYMLLERPSVNPHILQNGTQAAPVSVPTLPTAAQDNIDTLLLPTAIGHPYLEMYQTTAQTLMPLVHANKGYEIALDQVNNESVEYVPGGNRDSNPLGYLAPTSTAAGSGSAFLRVTLEIEDADGIDQMMIGYRKRENYVVPTSILSGGDPLYTDVVGLGIAAAAADPAIIRSITDINNSGVAVVSSTGFGLTNGSIVQLEVRLVGRKALFFINGVPVGLRIGADGTGAAITAQNTTPVPGYTVDTGDFMVPFIFIRQDAALSLVYLRRLECGLLVNAGLDPNNREV
jgi:hypothetical protein